MLTLEKRFVKSTELRPRAFESTAPRGMSETKRVEGTRGCKKPHNEEIHNPYFSLYVIKMIRPKRMR
jgi:hypothetical protein